MVTEGKEFTLKLQLDLKGIPLPLVDQTISEIRQMLTSIEERRFGGLAHANWVIDSDQLQIKASVNGVSADDLQTIISDAYQGLRAGETKKNALWPESFDEPTRRVARRLAGRIKRASPSTRVEATGHDPWVMQGESKVEHLALPRRHKETYEAWSSVDGKLDVISVHRRASFVIYEHGTQHRVRCTFPDGWMSNVKDYLGSRVIAEGYVRYREDGVPISLTQPTSLEKVPEPKQQDVGAYRGSLPGITGGMSSYEYVRQLREANA